MSDPLSKKPGPGEVAGEGGSKHCQGIWRRHENLRKISDHHEDSFCETNTDT